MGNSHYFRSNLDQPPPPQLLLWTLLLGKLRVCELQQVFCAERISYYLYNLYLKEKNKTKLQLGPRSLQLASFSCADSQHPREKKKHVDTMLWPRVGGRAGKQQTP